MPVYRPVLADLLSPVAAFLKLVSPAGKKSRCFLLESVEGGEHVGRFTFFGVNPFQVVSSRGRNIGVERGGKRAEESGNIFDYLREEGRRYHPVKLAGLPPFSAGAVGYLAHEVVRLIEKLPPRVEPDVDMDDALFMYFTDLA
ncbi:MAG: anthranilate synthase component I, partial [Terriglobia bacterium]